VAGSVRLAQPRFNDKKNPKRWTPRLLQGNARYYLLVGLLFAALLNVNLAGLFDPMAIFVRFLTFLFYPLVAIR